MPVYESHLSEYGGLRFGARVSAERQRRGLTLQEVSARSGLSTARLSQLENELYVPDVDQARSVAKALGVAFEVFFPSDRILPYQLKRYAEVRNGRPGLASGTQGAHRAEVWPLADLFVGRRLEPVLVRLLPGQVHQFRRHAGLEFAFVLKGQIEFVLRSHHGEHREELNPGDCIYIRSRQPYVFRCTDGRPAECIHVSTAPAIGGPGESDCVSPPEGPDQRSPGDSGCWLGTEIASLRQSRGWTAADLAQILGMRQRQLEQVERGERSAPLDAIVRLARVFGTPLQGLLREPGEEEPAYFIRRSTEIPTLPARPRRLPTDRPEAPLPNTYHPLCGDFSTLHMYPYLVRIRNVDMTMLVPHEHHGQEFFYVLEGQIELVTYAEDKKVSVRLEPGDSCYLDASVPHLLRGETRNPYSPTSAELIDVYWCPLGEQYLFGEDR